MITKNEDGTYPAYAWPGGYPIIYIMGDGAVICPGCANRENGSIAVDESEDDGMSDKSWTIVASDVHWEGGPEECAHCGKMIESAYGTGDE
jgi:hypothetical protein